jgi:hypothetical protein
LEALGRPATVPSLHADLGKVNEKFEQLQHAVSESAGRLAESTEQFLTQLTASAGRLDTVEHTSGLVYAETASHLRPSP